MPSWPHLNNAPIMEALVDIRVEIPPSCTLDCLKAVHEEIRPNYPTIRPRMRGVAKFEFGPKPPSATIEEHGPDGFFMESIDSRWVAQARTDGFTLSRLSPYENWAKLREEARRTWNIYEKHIRPIAITRIAVRFINRIAIPRPIKDLSRWFAVRPMLPSCPAEETEGLFMRVMAKRDGDVQSIVSLALNDIPQEGDPQLYFDIDVFQSKRHDRINDPLWILVDTLRDIKNDIFFQGITTEMLQRLEPKWENE